MLKYEWAGIWEGYKDEMVDGGKRNSVVRHTLTGFVAENSGADVIRAILEKNKHLGNVIQLEVRLYDN